MSVSDTTRQAARPVYGRAFGELSAPDPKTYFLCPACGSPCVMEKEDCGVGIDDDSDNAPVFWHFRCTDVTRGRTAKGEPCGRTYSEIPTATTASTITTANTETHSTTATVTVPVVPSEVPAVNSTNVPLTRAQHLAMARMNRQKK